MSIKVKEAELIDEFSMFDDWMDKYEYIIDMGKDLPGIPESEKTDENLVRGCQSKVWLHAGTEEGKLNFQADSDALITKGIISLLIRVMNGEEPKEVAESEFAFIDAIGLKEHLSPNRANGLASMIKKMKAYALGLSLKNA